MKKSGLLTLVIFLVLLLSCPLLAQEKTNNPGYQVKRPAPESLISQRYGPDDCGSEAEGYESWGSESEKYPPGKYGPLGNGTESEGY